MLGWEKKNVQIKANIYGDTPTSKTISGVTYDVYAVPGLYDYVGNVFASYLVYLDFTDASNANAVYRLEKSATPAGYKITTDTYLNSDGIIVVHS